MSSAALLLESLRSDIHLQHPTVTSPINHYHLHQQHPHDHHRLAVADPPLLLTTLPIADGLHSDTQSRNSNSTNSDVDQLSVSITSDSYRAHLLRVYAQKRISAAANQQLQEASPITSSLPQPHCASYLHSNTILHPHDILQLTDALLCNTTLTSLTLSHSSLTTHSCQALTVLVSQHPTLTTISLEGNQLGLHPTGPGGSNTRGGTGAESELGTLFAALASRSNLPHLMHLNLSKNQFTPSAIELLSKTFLQHAPSIQVLDLRDNDIGLRGGWALVDAMRVRNERDVIHKLAPLCELYIDCERPSEHQTSSDMLHGFLPQPNLAQTLSTQYLSPGWRREMEVVLQMNRNRRDQGEMKKMEIRKEEEERKEIKVAAAGASAISSMNYQQHKSAAATIISPYPSPTNTSSSSILATSPSGEAEFISPHSYHSSLGRLVQELNQERMLRKAAETALSDAREKEKVMQQALEKQAREIETLITRFDEQVVLLTAEQSRSRELELSLISSRSQLSDTELSHKKQVMRLYATMGDIDQEKNRLARELKQSNAEREDDRVKWMRESRQEKEHNETQLNALIDTHQSTLATMERRLDAIRCDREKDGATVGMRSLMSVKEVMMGTTATLTPVTATTMMNATRATTPLQASSFMTPSSTTGSTTSSSSSLLSLSPKPLALITPSAATIPAFPLTTSSSANTTTTTVGTKNSATTPTTVAPTPSGATATAIVAPVVAETKSEPKRLVLKQRSY